MCANSGRNPGPPPSGSPLCFALCYDGRLSLFCFLITAGLVLIPSVPQIHYGIVPQVWGAVLWGPVLYYALINMIIRFVLRNHDYQVSHFNSESYLTPHHWHFSTGRHTCLLFGIRRSRQCAGNLLRTHRVAAVRGLWMLHVSLPLLGVPGHRICQSAYLEPGLVYAESLGTLWPGSCRQLD